MVTLFEFLGNEPIENVVTCMNFKVDKVIFFGYADSISGFRNSHTSFLTKHCGVREVLFSALPGNDLQPILTAMRSVIGNELEHGANIYFDITGGEDLILVAFGMLSSEFNTPMHRHDIPSNRHIDLIEGAKGCMSDEVPKQEVRLDLNGYIELYGGKIDNTKLLSSKNTDDSDLVNDVKKLWEFQLKYVKIWHIFGQYLKDLGTVSNSLRVSHGILTFRDKELKGKDKLTLRLDKFDTMLQELEDLGMIKNYSSSDGFYQFEYKNSNICQCLKTGGNPLEWHVFLEQKPLCDDALLGIHLDWDGIIEQGNKDVYNEFDVLTLTGLIPTFISCKSGNMEGDKIREAFYELETIADRFGGKYAKRVLAVVSEPGPTHLKRAEEMNIEVRVYKAPK